MNTMTKDNIYQSDNIYMMALQGTPCKVLTDKEVVTVLSIALDKARADCNYKIDNTPEGKKENRDNIASLLNDIRLFFKTLTDEELKLCIYFGSRAKYDEAGKVFISVANVSRWLATYMMCKERNDARRTLQAILNPPPVKVIPTPEELEKERVIIITNAYEAYKNTGTFNDVLNMVYDAIEKYKKVPFDDIRKRQIAKRAKDHLINKGDIKHPNNLSSYDKDLIRVQAKKFALVEFFNDIAEVDEDILHFIKPEDE